MSDQPVRTSGRVNVTYREYVRDYAKAIARYMFIFAIGAGVLVTAIVTLEGPLMPLIAVIGLAMAAGGGSGLLATETAHNEYTNHLAISHTTYQPATARPASQDGRAFIPSTSGRTINVGPHWLTPELWGALADTAGRDGRLTRDGAVGVLPRSLYRNWAATLGELVRLGLVDATGAVTPIGKQNVTPYPSSGPERDAAYSTHARRTHGEG